MKPDTIYVRERGLQDYVPIWREMQALADKPDPLAEDELWLLQHYPVYTLGRVGKPEHVLNPGSIPVVNVDRGGQVTYHGPGQVIVYLLINLRRNGLGVRQVVSAMENAVIQLLSECGIDAQARADAPGVYVQGKKIAALGLRVRNGLTYHGLSLNVNMDIRPFQGINPCGYQGMEVAQMSDWISEIDERVLKQRLVECLAQQLGYNEARFVSEKVTSISNE